MCLLLSLGCCGSSSPRPAKKQLEKHLNQEHSLNIQQQQPTNKSNTLTTINSINTINFHSDVSLSELQLNGSLLSLPLSMSLSLMPIPSSTMNSSIRSSWAAEEEFYDMDEYVKRAVPWLQEASDHNVKGV
ncbi:uncharacterized protein [Drosophila kikkawai]|uniref:Uncharacterized protein n=1 Tax=Drosophila kikkawai TaxID=30033 RepID=A0ABM3C5D4_DROKI|nr:uncharacterized protein LOC121502163 [Drosophila kikkawai]